MSLVFLSHATADAAVAELLREVICDWGYECFCDSASVGPGVRWEERILDALRNCFVVVVYATEAAMKSQWVFAEMEIARFSGKPMIPLRITPEVQLPGHLVDVQYIDASGRPGVRGYRQELQNALAELVRDAGQASRVGRTSVGPPPSAAPWRASEPPLGMGVAPPDDHLARAAIDWAQNGEREEFLWQGQRLAELGDSIINNGDDLRSRFLRASHAQEAKRLERESVNLARRVLDMLEPRPRRSEGDAERGLLLALAGIDEYGWSPQAERALRTGILVSRLRCRLRHDLAGVVGVSASMGRALTLGAGFIIIWQLSDGAELFRIGGRITAARLHPHDAGVCTGDAEGRIRMWDAVHGMEHQELGSHGEPVISLSLLPDGTVVSTGEDGAIRLWNPKGGEICQIHPVVADVPPATSSIGQLAVARTDGRVTLHDAKGIQIGELCGHSGSVVSLAFDVAGTRLVTGAENGTVRLWDVASQTALRVISPDVGPVAQVLLTQDGSRVFVRSVDGTARIWGDNGDLLHVLSDRDGLFTGAALAGTGNQLVTCTDRHVVQLWGPTGVELQRCVGHDGPITALDGSPSTQLITASADGSALVWSLNEGPELASLNHHGNRVAACLFGVSEYPITGASDGTLRVFRPDGKLEREISAHETGIEHLSRDRAGNLVVTTARDEPAKLWCVPTCEPRGSFGRAGEVRVATIAPDGDRIAFGNRDGTVEIQFIDNRRKVLSLVGHGGPIASLQFSSDGQLLLSASQDGSARIWDSQAGAQCFQLRVNGYALRRACFDSQSSRVLTIGAEDVAPRVWDARRGKELFVLRGHEEELNDGAFSPQDSHIGTAARDGTTRIWNANTGVLLHTMRGPTKPICRLHFDPTGQRLAAASADGSAVLWDTTTGALLCSLVAHRGPLSEVMFSSDGQRLLTASADGTARLWSVPPREKLTTIAKQHVYRQLTDDERRDYGLPVNPISRRQLLLS